MTVDAVISWVDGNDPVLNATREGYLTAEASSNEEVAAPVRYCNSGEIGYCVDSLLRFAPWIRRIYIVTDGQDPGISSGKVEVVDHSVIFRGYGECLPVFNSNSIETFLWNIPGLSEHFLFLNDDFFLVSPSSPEDFFTDGKVICRARWSSLAGYRFQRWIKPTKHGRPHCGFKDFLVNGAALAPSNVREGSFLYLAHTPRPLLKSWFSGFCSEHPGAVSLNLQDRFRSPRQWQTQEPFYLDMYSQGRCIVENPSARAFYYSPRKHGRMLGWADREEALCVCANSLGSASGPQRERFFGWLRERTLSFGQDK